MLFYSASVYTLSAPSPSSLFSSSAHLHLSILFRNSCPCQKSHIYFPDIHHRWFYLPVSLLRPTLLSYISFSTLVCRHLCHCPCMISLLSRLSAAVFVILPRFYCILHHIVLHCPTPFTAIVILNLCRVSIALVSAIPASLLPLSSSNLLSPLPLELSPVSPLPSFLPRFYCPVYFTNSTSSRRLHHSTSPPAISLNIYCHVPFYRIYNTSSFYLWSYTFYNQKVTWLSLLRHYM